MRRLGHHLFTLCSAVSLALTAGCINLEREWYKQQISWGYVYAIGDAGEIAEWTLAQTEARRIAHGMATLQDLAGDRGNNV